MFVIGLAEPVSPFFSQPSVNRIPLESHSKMKTINKICEDLYTPGGRATISTGVALSDYCGSRGITSWKNSVADFLLNFSGRPSIFLRLGLGPLVERIISQGFMVRKGNNSNRFADEDGCGAGRDRHSWRASGSSTRTSVLRTVSVVPERDGRNTSKVPEEAEKIDLGEEPLRNLVHV